MVHGEERLLVLEDLTTDKGLEVTIWGGFEFQFVFNLINFRASLAPLEGEVLVPQLLLRGKGQSLNDLI